MPAANFFSSFSIFSPNDERTNFNLNIQTHQKDISENIPNSMSDDSDYEHDGVIYNAPTASISSPKPNPNKIAIDMKIEECDKNLVNVLTDYQVVSANVNYGLIPNDVPEALKKGENLMLTNLTRRDRYVFKFVARANESKAGFKGGGCGLLEKILLIMEARKHLSEELRKLTDRQDKTGKIQKGAFIPVDWNEARVRYDISKKSNDSSGSSTKDTDIDERSALKDLLLDDLLIGMYESNTLNDDSLGPIIMRSTMISRAKTEKYVTKYKFNITDDTPKPKKRARAGEEETNSLDIVPDRPTEFTMVEMSNLFEGIKNEATRKANEKASGAVPVMGSGGSNPLKLTSDTITLFTELREEITGFRAMGLNYAYDSFKSKIIRIRNAYEAIGDWKAEVGDEEVFVFMRATLVDNYLQYCDKIQPARLVPILKLCDPISPGTSEWQKKLKESYPLLSEVLANDSGDD